MDGRQYDAVVRPILASSMGSVTGLSRIVYSRGMTRILITGAAGSGTTTLGRALAAKLGSAHEDTDAYYWVATDPPYTTIRPPEARIALLLPKLKAERDWVLSGSPIEWGAALEPLYELIVFLRLDHDLRMARLGRREAADFGPRIVPGGDMARINAEFLEWASSYDEAGPERRSLAQHERWLAAQKCPVLRLDSAEPVDALLAAVLAALPEKQA
jgi:adenylate kinase family enzyme